MRTVTQVWALIGPSYQKNFDTKAQLLLYMTQQWFLDQFEEGSEFIITPIYVVVDAAPLQLEYHK